MSGQACFDPRAYLSCACLEVAVYCPLPSSITEGAQPDDPQETGFDTPPPAQPLQPQPLHHGDDAAERQLQQPFQFGQQPAQLNLDDPNSVAPAVQQLLELATGQLLLHLPVGPQFAFAVLGGSDSSSENDMTQPAAELRFAEVDVVLGDARSFCEQILKGFRTSTRMQAGNITQHAYAVSAYCDDVTHTAIEIVIAADVFDCGVGGAGIAVDAPIRR